MTGARDPLAVITYDADDPVLAGTISLVAPSIIQFSPATASVAEDAGSATLTIIRTGSLALAATVNYAIAGGTADSSADFSNATGSVTFAPNEATKTIIFPIVNDNLVEVDETFVVALTLGDAPGASLGDFSTATVKIADDDSPATLSFSSPTYTVGESAGSVAITITRAGGTTQGAIVNYHTTLGTADASDYTPASATVEFLAGQTSSAISIPILNDTLVEGPEMFNISLSDPSGSGVTIGTTSTATVTITDDDTPATIQFSAASYSVVENGVSATVTVTRAGGTTQAASVAYASAFGTATAADFTAVSGTLNFAAGETSKTISVPILDDQATEGAESFTLTLSSPTGSGVTLGAIAQTTVTIADDDGPATIQFESSSLVVTEGGPALIVAVTRSGQAGRAAGVQYAASSGTAAAGSDFVLAPGTIAFAPGETRKTFAVDLPQDAVVEGDETFTITLSDPTGVATSLGIPITATVTIADDDAPTSLQLEATAFSVTERTPSVTLTVVRSGGTTQAASVNYATADGTAQASHDYAAASGVLQFAPGETRKAVTIPIIDDAIVEGNETFTLGLSGAAGSGVSLGSALSAVVTIHSDDAPRPPGVLGLASPSYGVVENAGVAQLIVQRQGGTAGPISVHYTTVSQGEVGPNDFVAASGEVSWADGEAGDREIDVRIVDDATHEADEAFRVELSGPTGGATLGPAGQAAVVVIHDDDPELPHDTTLPQVVAFGANHTAKKITQLALRFSEPLDPASAQNPANYAISGSGAKGKGTSITGVSYDPATYSVFLTVAGGLATTKARTVTVHDVGDASGNLLATRSTNLTASILTSMLAPTIGGCWGPPAKLPKPSKPPAKKFAKLASRLHHHGDQIQRLRLRPRWRKFPARPT